jgi:hypothetical protein
LIGLVPCGCAQVQQELTAKQIQLAAGSFCTDLLAFEQKRGKKREQ